MDLYILKYPYRKFLSPLLKTILKVLDIEQPGLPYWIRTSVDKGKGFRKGLSSTFCYTRPTKASKPDSLATLGREFLEGVQAEGWSIM